MVESQQREFGLDPNFVVEPVYLNEYKGRSTVSYTDGFISDGKNTFTENLLA
jgi:hypothetical protein